MSDESANARAVRSTTTSVEARSARRDLTVDLSDLSFADSSLMLDLAMLARRLRQAGRRVILSGAQPDIQRLIELVGIDRLDGVDVTYA